MSETAPMPKNWRIKNQGQFHLMRFFLTYAWGPLILAEFRRTTLTEGKAIEEGGGEVPQMPTARMSWESFRETFNIELPLALTLPSRMNRSRGETKPWIFKAAKMSFYRLYQLVFHTQVADGMPSPLRLATDCEWPAILAFAFRKTGQQQAIPMTTKVYLKFENSVATTATAIALLLGYMENKELENLSPEVIGQIKQGDFTHIRNLANRAGLSLGLMLAAVVALYLRPESEAIRASLKSAGKREDAFRPLEDLLWAPIKGYRDTDLFATYSEMVTHGMAKPPKRGPRPARNIETTGDSEAKPAPGGTEPGPTRPAIPDVPPEPDPRGETSAPKAEANVPPATERRSPFSKVQTDFS